MDTCPDSRQDLKEEYQARYNIIQEYAPKLLTEDEIQAVLEEKVFGSSVHKKQGTDYEGCHGRTERKSRRQSDQSGRCQTVPVRFRRPVWATEMGNVVRKNEIRYALSHQGRIHGRKRSPSRIISSVSRNWALKECWFPITTRTMDTGNGKMISKESGIRNLSC